MSLTSFSFFVFLSVTLLFYYVIKPAQKYVLLIASIYFYLSISAVSTLKLSMLIIYIVIITYIGALMIDKVRGKKRTLILFSSITAILISLIVLKYAYNVTSVFNSLFQVAKDFSWLKFSAIIGISYYALSAIGYLIDVYWENYKAERNIVDVALFIFYFPQLISGPITRFSHMHNQFNKRIIPTVTNFSYGMRRMAWGYFKKLVISERFGIIVSAVYGNYHEYSFIGIFGATLCYTIQLYTDFSGCMDIIMGVSSLFGIELPENFKAPFFSESIQEFWQRWHITLGTWFKDYLMYPVQKSSIMQTIGKMAKKRFGKKIGKKIPIYLSMLLLWSLIGIWHGGTGYYFIASGAIPGIFLILSDFLQPFFKKLIYIFHINTTCESWHIFKRIRTMLFICICWMVICSNGTHEAIDILWHMFSDLWNYTTINNAFSTFGLGVMDMFIMLIGIAVLYFADMCIYNGTTIFRKVDEQNWGFKVVLIYAEIMLILLHGMVGSSSFIYFQF